MTKCTRNKKQEVYIKGVEDKDNIITMINDNITPKNCCKQVYIHSPPKVPGRQNFDQFRYES